MRIVIDARMYGLKHAGIGRYVSCLIEKIAQLDKKNDYFILLRQKKYNTLRFSNPRFKKILADYPHYSFREQFLLPLQLIELKPDLVHFPHFNVPIFWWGKQVVTIHDLIKHQSRGPATTTRWPLFYYLKYLNYRFLVWLAVKRACRVIVPSRYWQKELVARYHLPKDKVVITYEGVDKKFKIGNWNLKIENLLKKFNIKKPYIVYVGSLYPHKNVGCLVAAAKKINIKLVVISSRNVFLERFKKQVAILGAEKLVTLTGFLPDNQVVAVLKNAETFVTPSLLEGFGLPGLEAMAVGVPVLAARASCLPEIYEGAALYFDPHNPADLTAKIKKITSDRRLRAQLVRHGQAQVKKYSWQKTAKQTLAVYKSLASGENLISHWRSK